MTINPARFRLGANTAIGAVLGDEKSGLGIDWRSLKALVRDPDPNFVFQDLFDYADEAALAAAGYTLLETGGATSVTVPGDGTVTVRDVAADSYIAKALAMPSGTYDCYVDVVAKIGAPTTAAVKLRFGNAANTVTDEDINIGTLAVNPGVWQLAGVHNHLVRADGANWYTLNANAAGTGMTFGGVRFVKRSQLYLGDINSLLTYTTPSTKWITNAFGVLEAGATLRCDHDPATLDSSTTPLSTQYAIWQDLFDYADRDAMLAAGYSVGWGIATEGTTYPPLGVIVHGDGSVTIKDDGGLNNNIYKYQYREASGLPAGTYQVYLDLIAKIGAPSSTGTAVRFGDSGDLDLYTRINFGSLVANPGVWQLIGTVTLPPSDPEGYMDIWSTTTNAGWRIGGIRMVQISGESQTVGDGTPVRKTLTTSGAYAYQPGQHVRLTDAGNIANWMLARVVSYAANVLVVDAYEKSGDFWAANWKIIVANGVLHESARTNLLLYSADFTNAAWVKTGVTVTADVAVVPDGTTTADRLSAGASVVQTVATSSLSTFVFSIWMKSASPTSVTVAVRPTGGATVPVTSVVNVLPVWQRVPVSIIALTGITALQACIEGITQDIEVWGAQLELPTLNGPSNTPTSYIPTTSAAVARNVDTVTMLVSALPSLSAALSAFTDFTPNFRDSGASPQYQAIVFTNSTVNYLQIYLSTVSTRTGAPIASHRNSQIITIEGPSNFSGVSGVRQRWAYSHDAAVCRFVVNGTAMDDDKASSSPLLPQPTSISFSCTAAAGASINGHLHSTTVVPRLKSVAALQMDTGV